MSKIYFLFLFTTISIESFGALYFEPFVGQKLSTTREIAGPNGYYKWKSTLKGFFYGTKLGYELPLNLVFGLDYRLGKTISNHDASNGPFLNTVDYKSTFSSLGLFARLDLLSTVNFWGTYHFSYKEGDLRKIYTKGGLSGKGMSFGIGYALYTSFNINLEYSDIAFYKQDTALLSIFNVVGSDKFIAKDIMLSISFPISWKK